MAAGAGFWNLMAKNYAKSPISDEASYQEKLKKTQAFFHSDMDVLEIGCGTGSTAILHAPLVGSYEGVDFSKKMLGFANEKVKKSGLKNLKFTCQPIDDVARAPESVDMVIALNIIHLLPNHKEVLADIYSLLKPGGVFVSSTLCLEEMNGALKMLLRFGKGVGVLPPIQDFSSDDLQEMIQEAGFDFDEIWRPKRGAGVYIAARKPA